MSTYSVPGIPAQSDDNLHNIVLDLADFRERDTSTDARTKRSATDYGSSGSTLAQQILLSTFSAPGQKRSDMGWTSTFGVLVTPSVGDTVFVQNGIVVKTTIVISGLTIAELTPSFACNAVRAHQRLPWGTPASGSPNLDFMTSLLQGYSRIK